MTLELGDPAVTLQPLAPDRPLGAIDAVYLKDLLGQIHAHTSKLRDDSSSFRDWWHTPPVWHSMPLGLRRVHPIASGQPWMELAT